MVVVVSRHLSSLLARVTAAHGETSCVLAIPGRRCNSSINTKSGRQLRVAGRGISSSCYFRP